MTAQPRWRVHPRVIHTRITNGAVLLDPDAKIYFELNATGAIVWREIVDAGEHGATLDALATTVSAAFDVDHATAAEDVSAYLEELAEGDLVVRL